MVLSEAEKSEGRLTPETLSLALRTLREAGYVVLEAVIPADWISHMLAAFEADVNAYLEAPEQKERWLVKNLRHVGMMVPMSSPYMDPVAVENPFALQIMEAAMGEDIYSTFYNTNTAWPGSGTQLVHRDAGHLFPDYPYVLPVTSVVVNINLVDFTRENGATEVWPGTHHLTDPIPDDGRRLDERAASLPSVQTLMPAGSLVVRDLRMWHRGVPNRSAGIRPMLAIVYTRGFLNRGNGMAIPLETWKNLSDRSRRLFRYNRVVDATGKPVEPDRKQHAQAGAKAPKATMPGGP